MNIAYGIKGKTAEKEAYGRRKIWSREKKEQESSTGISKQK